MEFDMSHGPWIQLVAASATAVLFTLAGLADLRSQPLSPDVYPPTSCRIERCLKGGHALERGDDERAVELLEGPLDSREQKMTSTREIGDMLLMSAVAHLRADRPIEAAGAFVRASTMIDPLRSYLSYRALRALLKAKSPPKEFVERLVRQRGALERDYPGSPLARLQLDVRVRQTPPSASRIRDGLGGEDETRAATCRMLKKLLTSSTFDDLSEERLATYRVQSYGACVGVDEVEPPPLDDYDPSAEARIRRAEHLYGAVQYEKALAELEQLDVETLEDDLRCRARFRLGRTLYRLDRDEASMKAYRTVAETCRGDVHGDERIRSLYALGREAYREESFDTSEQVFETILEDYPDRSHADDALLFLTRIHRERDERERALERTRRALRDYPDGDMVHEIVWEVLEPLYRDGQYEQFRRRLNQLDRPKRDEQYFSQGRLEYFRGRAAMELGDRGMARRAWQATWRRYPFSFYGYLAHLKLREHDNMDIPELDSARADVPPRWFYEQNDSASRGARRLVALGLPGMAAELEAGRIEEHSGETRGESDYWRLAALHHAAGHFETSHDIPRRRVSGRPWVEPELGRRVRWQIAFPDPYESSIREAVEAEAAQSQVETLPLDLVAALIREESGLDADIQSWAGAVGLMQLMPRTARNHDDDIDGTATPDRLQTARINLRVGVDHLFYLAEIFDSHPVLMLGAYNAGAGNVRRWLRASTADEVALWVEDITIRQTRHYVKRIVGSYGAYQWLEGVRHLDTSVGEPVDVE